MENVTFRDLLFENIRTWATVRRCAIPGIRNTALWGINFHRPGKFSHSQIIFLNHFLGVTVFRHCPKNRDVHLS